MEKSYISVKMKKIKLILCILGIMAISVQTAFAEITFSKSGVGKREDEPRRVISTGQGYFVDGEDDNIFYSKNKSDWENVTDKLPENIIIYRSSFPRVKIIETDNNFIMCNIPFKKAK